MVTSLFSLHFMIHNHITSYYTHLSPMGKRSREDMEGHAKSDGAQPQSQFMPMFETFRAELDEHHDRRERIIKASRDVTAASKKM